MGFWGKLKSVLKAPFQLPLEVVKGVAKVPGALISAAGQTVRSAADVARTALPGLVRTAAQMAPIAGGVLGGPLGQIAGQVASQALGALGGGQQGVADAALHAAQQMAGGWAPPVQSLLPPAPGAGFPFGG